MRTSLIHLWAFRGFIFATLGREFSLRYRNSVFGIFWVIANPLAMILVYTLIFSQVMQARLPGVDSPFAYSIYLMAGLLPWGLLNDLISRGAGLFLEQANLIKKVKFPKLALLVVAVCNALINFTLVESIFIVFLVLINQFPGWPILALVPLLVIQVWMCAAITLILGLLNVFFRDIAHITNIALQFGFWLTPIVYALNIIPSHYSIYLKLNPIANLFEAYHTIFVEHDWPRWLTLWPTALVTGVLTIFAYYLFQNRSAEMVDQL